MPPPPSVDALIAALQAQRGVLGDAAVDFALDAIRGKLARLAAADSTPRLRQVSVLFCDIVGSTALLQRLDAEDALTAVGEVLRRFAALVHEAGGRVLRYTGDGLKAAFGTEQAREDDAERAVDCGLALLAAARAHAQHLQQTLGVAGFAVRVGVNSGPVVLGGGVEADNSAMGHAVHIAARLEQAAPAGELLISQGTWALVRGRFAMQAQPPLVVKGADEPLLTYRVLAALPRSQRSEQRGVDGVSTPLVGRAAELARLQALFEQARQAGRQQAATLLADAGVGKSRLARELTRALQPAPADTGTALQVWGAAARPSGRLQPYGLLRELVARRCTLADDEPADGARDKLVAWLAPLIGEQGALRARQLGHLLGFPFPDDASLQALPGSELRRLAWRALRRALAGAARQGPLLLVLDDLHWADDASLDFLHDLLQHPLDAPVLVLGLARPTLLELRPDWPPEGERHTRLPLAALAQHDGAALAAALLHRLPEPPAALTRLLVQRAGGNPFYMEELLRMLIDEGVVVTGASPSASPGTAPGNSATTAGVDAPWQVHEDRLGRLRLPTTLVGVLQSRLDALPAEARTVLQQASIVGPVFWTEALAALTPAAPAALPLLAGRGFVQAHERSAFDGSSEYGFQHALLHEVTYGTVLKPQRREGHGLCAQWLAARVGERGNEFVAVTADHFERAGDSSSALRYFDRAAGEALARDAHSAAVAYYQRALAQPALADDVQRRFVMMDSCWGALDSLGRSAEAETLLQAMHALAEASDDDGQRALVAANHALHADRHGDRDTASAQAQRAVALGERSGRAPAMVLGHGELAWLAVCRGDFDTAERHLDLGLAWVPRLESRTRDAQTNHAIHQHMLMQIRIEALMRQGRLIDAAAALEALPSGEAGFAAQARCATLERRAIVAHDLGEFEQAESLRETLLALAGEAELPRQQLAALTGLGHLALQRQDLPAVAQRLAQAEALLRTTANAQAEAELLALRADLQVAQARHAEAAVLYERAGRVFETAGLSDHALRCRADHAMAQLRDGDADAARALVHPLLVAPEAASADTATEHPAEQSTDCRYRCWLLLRALEDPRAQALLDGLHADLQRQLQVLPPAAGSRLMQRVPMWRDLAAARGRLPAGAA